MTGVRLGIGSGLPSGGWTEGTWPPDGWFNEPENCIVINAESTHVIKVVSAGANGFPQEIATLQTGLSEIGTARIRKVGGNLIFGWSQSPDWGGDGTFTETTVAISSYPMLGDSSRLFFGV